MEMKLVIKGLAKIYPGRPVFEGIDAEAGEGEVLIITGANGSGKSTFIRILCGFIRPTRGQAYLNLDNKKMSRLEIRPLIGLVSPDLVLYDECSPSLS